MVFLSLMTLLLAVPATVDNAQAVGIYCKERLTIPYLLVLTDDIGEPIYNVIDMREDDTGAAISGTEGIDLILAPDSGVEIMAKGGSDCIIGGAGDDIIYGDETIRTGGDDYIYGNDGNDSISAGGGNDWVDGGPGDDALYGMDGDDRLRGGPGNDIMVSGTGYDTVIADLHDKQYQKPEDSIQMEETDDSVDDDKDQQVTKQGGDQSGQDTSQSTLSRETAAEPTYCKENLTISELVDGRHYNLIDERNGSKAKIKGTGDDDLILAHDGGTEILGKKGNDCIIGGAGDDLIKGNKGNDHIYGGNGADDLRGNLGDDFVYGDAGDKRIAGGQGNDTCTDTPNTKSNCENLT